MIKMECDICHHQSENASDFCRVIISRYKTINDCTYTKSETKDICYECSKTLLGFDVKAPITDSSDIADLELSVRAYNCLKRGGYTTYGEVKNLTVEEGMKIRNLGKKALEEVLQKIKDVEGRKETENEM